ncbi:TRAP transporter permease [Paremcibacter congregatus]|uniref:TRAP transporter permease n=1 Tax=Paremcibacter congregatus TaxID=2043170 RepID=UPI003A8D3F29
MTARAAIDENTLHLLEDIEQGGRHPAGWSGRLLTILALCWSLFQLYYASPVPFLLAGILPDSISGYILFNDTEARSIHLAFAVALAFMAYPRTYTAPQHKIPLYDWVLFGVGIYCALYICINYQSLALRVGAFTPFDLAVGVSGIGILLEASRRVLGLPMVCVAVFFLAYIFFGNSGWVPDDLRWKGASLHKAMSPLWLTTEGVYGVAVGVSVSFVFLFVLFGALLEKAGAGNYFIRVAFSLLGHLRGGPAKAAVIASGLTGLISGSSIANVVTTGTFTVPLMRKVGFSREEAGAVEVASSVNGQIMPPVMGAAAFLMVEYVGIPYTEVIKHAFLPALISYIALVYIVHLEACKKGMTGQEKRDHGMTFFQRLFMWATIILGFIVLSFVTYYGLGWIKTLTGDFSGWVIAVVLGGAYVGLLRYCAGFPDCPDDPDLEHLGPTGEIVKGGLYYILPVVVLIWCLMIERLSPGLSAFWASLLMVGILLSHKSLKAFFRGEGELAGYWAASKDDFSAALIEGARNMVGIGLATATAGIIVGAVSLTGVGQVLAGFVELLSAGNLILMLFFTGVISLILGMGLPTTANYIVVSSLMVPVITLLGAQNGLIIELIAVHLFVFYFGIMADVTPPVGLASFAAAAVSGGDPIKTGLKAFVYSLRMIILPFIFIFYPELLMIGISGPVHFILVVVTAVLGILCFAASTQGYFLIRSKLWESSVLALVAFTLLAPGFWVDRIVSPWQTRPLEELRQQVEQAPADSLMQISLLRRDFDGKDVTALSSVALGPKASFEERLRFVGLDRIEKTGAAYQAEARFGGPLDNPELDERLKILAFSVPAPQPAAAWMTLPALFLLGFVVWRQRNRRLISDR